MIFREENGVLLYQYQYQSTFCTCCNIRISVDFQRMVRQYQHTHAGAQREQLEHGAAYEQTTEAAGECPTRRLPSCKCLVARLTCRTKLCYDGTVSTVQAVHDHFLPFTRDRRVTYRLWPKLHVRLPTSDYTPSNWSTRPCRRTLITCKNGQEYEPNTSKLYLQSPKSYVPGEVRTRALAPEPVPLQ